jgi:hypothetical protein
LVLISIQVLPRRRAGSADSKTAAVAAGEGRQVIRQSLLFASSDIESIQRAPAASTASAALRCKS